MPTLPQELINLIVDLVALQKCREDVASELDVTKTLRACSLVSRSFHTQSRKHLFSKVDFYADKSAQKRAKRLFRILDNEANKDLVLGIRSFKFIIDMSSAAPPKIFTLIRVSQLYRRSKVTFFKIVRRLGLRQNYLLKVMELLTQSSLESFAIDVRNGILNWISVGELATSLFLKLRFGGSLKSLRFTNISHLNRSLAIGAEPSNNLRELVLRNITFSHINGFHAPLSNSELGHFARVERLDLQHRTYLYIFPPPESSTPPSGSGPLQFPFQCLPRLRTLVIAFPISAPTLASFWEVVKAFAPSLENLEVWDICWFLPRPLIEATSISLSQLPNLQNLKLSAARYQHDLIVKLETMKNFLASATTSLAIRSITIELDIGSHNYNPRQVLFSSTESRALDKTLTSPILTNLRKVHVIVKQVCYPRPGKRQDLSLSKDQMVDDIDVRSLFPTVSDSPSVYLEVSVEVPSRPNPGRVGIMS